MNVEVVSSASCQSQYPEDTITSNMICAGVPGDGKDTCNVSLIFIFSLIVPYESVDMVEEDT